MVTAEIIETIISEAPWQMTTDRTDRHKGEQRSDKSLKNKFSLSKLMAYGHLLAIQTMVVC